jgi:hypothetical protein
MDQLCFAGWQWQAGLLFSWWNATKKARAVYSGRASAHLFGESSPRTRSSSMMEGGITSYFLPFAPLLEDKKGPGRIGGPLCGFSDHSSTHRTQLTALLIEAEIED